MRLAVLSPHRCQFAGLVNANGEYQGYGGCRGERAFLRLRTGHYVCEPCAHIIDLLQEMSPVFRSWPEPTPMYVAEPAPIPQPISSPPIESPPHPPTMEELIKQGLKWDAIVKGLGVSEYRAEQQLRQRWPQCKGSLVRVRDELKV